MTNAARGDKATDQLSLFGALRQHYGDNLPVSTFSLPTLAQFVHTFQETILQRRIPALLFAGFQHMLDWEEEFSRCRALAEVARRVSIFAHDLPPAARQPPIRYVSLAADDPLRREVFLLGISAQFSFLVCGQQRLVYADRQTTFTFDTIFSFDPPVIQMALELIQPRFVQETPDADDEWLRQSRPITGSEPALVSSLLVALAGREDALRQQLRRVERQFEQERLLNQSLIETVPALQNSPQQALQLAVERQRAHLLAGLLRNASFDFRTPLSVLNTSIHLLARIDDPKHHQEQIAILSRQAEYLTRLTEVLFTIIELESRDDATLRPVLLDDMARTMAITLRELAEPKGVSVHLHQEERTGLVYADEGKLYLALRQIADNAVRYTPPGGSITLATGVRREYSLIEIRDTGAGISPDELPHIFDHFYRGSGTEAGVNLGLGLTIARIVIEKHGGFIEVESTPGQGSAFRVLLPRLQA